MSEPVVGSNSSVGVVAVITLVSRLLGFGRWIIFSLAVGSGCFGSAYGSANLLPNVIFEVAVGGALAASIVPTLVGARTAGLNKLADQRASAFVTWTFFLTIVLAAALAFSSNFISKSLDDTTGCPPLSSVIAKMLLIFSPQIIFYGIGVVLIGILQSHGRYIAAAVAPLASNLVVICGYLGYWYLSKGDSTSFQYLPNNQELNFLAWATTAGVIALSLPLFIPIARAGIKIRLRYRLDLEARRSIKSLAGAGILVLLAQQSFVLLSGILAQKESAMAVYQYSQAVFLLPFAVLLTPIITASFTNLNELYRINAAVKFREQVRSVSSVILLMATLCSAVLVAVAPGVQDFFQLIDKGGDQLTQLSDALTWTAPGLIGFALIAMLGRAFYALNQAAVATRCIALGWTFSAVTALMVREISDLTSGISIPILIILGFSYSCGMTVAAILLIRNIAKFKLGDFPIGNIFRGKGTFLAASISAAASAAMLGRIAVNTLLEHLPNSIWVSVLSAISGATICAVIWLTILRLSHPAGIKELFRNFQSPRPSQEINAESKKVEPNND